MESEDPRVLKNTHLPFPPTFSRNFYFQVKIIPGDLCGLGYNQATVFKIRLMIADGPNATDVVFQVLEIC